MTHDPTIYDIFLVRLAMAGGSLRLTLNEALTWWIAALQREAARANPWARTGEIDRSPKLMVLGLDGDDELFTEVVITDDDPENLFDGTWWPIELWES